MDNVLPIHGFNHYDSLSASGLLITESTRLLSDAFWGFRNHRKKNHKVLKMAPFAICGMNIRPQYG